MDYTTPLLSGDTLHESDPPDILTRARWRFFTLVDYISKTLRSIKDATQESIYLSLASITNALEACTTERLLRDVGRASAPSDCPEGNVRLHELCKSCTLFSQRSAALSSLDDSNSRPDWPPQQRYRLCTVAHLRRLNGRCHFCTILHSLVSRLISLGIVKIVDKSWLDLCILPHKTPWEHNSIRLDALLYPSGLFVGSFDLRLFEGM
jgi:hypothetical protein